MEKRYVEISTGIIIKTILIILGIWFVYMIRDIIAIFFIALILTAAINPLVNWMERKKISRSISVLLIYLVLFLIIGFLFYLLIPQLIEQVKDFYTNAPSIFSRLSETFSGIRNFMQNHNLAFDWNTLLNDMANIFSFSSGRIFSTTANVFSWFVSVVVVLSLTFYLAVKKDGMKLFIQSLVPLHHQDYVISLTERMEAKIGKWMQGQLFLMLTIFVLDFIVLWAMGIPYALTIALIGGILEVVPYLGPILGAIPAVMMGFLISPAKGLLILLFYIVIQQIEGHLIVPQVMRKAVGINPIAIILALLVGTKLGGMMGAVLAVPLVAALSVLAKDLIYKKNIPGTS